MVLEYVCFNITDYCNMSCPYCYRIGGEKPGFVSEKSAYRYIDFLVNNGCKTISITGGEPLLNPSWKEIVQYCRNRKLFTILSTNGLLLNIDDPILNSVDCLSISLDGSTPEINAFTRSTEQFIKTKEILEKYDKSRYTFKLKINTVVSKFNIGDLDNIFELLGQKSVIWKLFKVRQKGEFYRFPKEMIADDEEIVAKYTEIKKRKSKCSVYYMSDNSKSIIPPDYFILNHDGNLFLGTGDKNILLNNIEKGVGEIGNTKILINNQYCMEMKDDFIEN